MRKILANDGLEQSGIDILTKHGFDVITTKVPQNEIADYINQHKIEAILVRSATQVRKDIIDACPDLKLIGRGGVGMDNIDVAYAREQGIAVVNTPEASTQSVAELVIAHLFSIARYLYDANRQMPEKGHTEFAQLKKKYANAMELQGKTLGIIGLGKIGQAVANLAIGLGMKVLPYNRTQKSGIFELDLFHLGDVFEIEYTTLPLDEVLAKSDFITVHTPKTSDGKALIGAEEFKKLKDGVVLINTSRGGVIDEAALIENLDNGKVAFAGLDVFENEPTPNPVLLKHPKISLTPHVGGATVEAQNRIGVELTTRIIEILG